MRYLLTALCVFLSLSVTTDAQSIARKKLATAEHIINTFYVDSVDEDKIVEQAIISMLKTLDPHSAYSNPEETRELTTPLQGNFSGIGIQFNMLNDTLYVIQTVAGGPSEKVGILAGDKIITAGDSILSGVKRKNSSILNILRGPKGSTIDVDVIRRGEPKPISFRITRDDIPVESVDVAYMADPTTGYIRVTRFAETTPREFAEAIYGLRQQGMKNLIIDLQDNGGGYLNAAISLAEQFLGRGSTVVSTRAPRLGLQEDYKVKRPGMMQDGRVVVLVNQYSASASEILSGALQDYDRGAIVGRRTFGKGLVQRPFPFDDGSMIRLTISKYYTPSGRSIQKPYTKGNSEEYEHDMVRRYESGELTHADSIHFDSSLRTYTLRNHRPIYGGGGIMPDLFVPVDTSDYSDYYRDIVAKGTLNRFSINYVDEHRKELKRKYPTENKYISDFKVTPEIMKQLQTEAEKDSVKFDSGQYARSEQTIATVLKGLIGRDLFTQRTYSRIVNPMNPVYTQGLELINDEKRYNELLKNQ